MSRKRIESLNPRRRAFQATMLWKGHFIKLQFQTRTNLTLSIAWKLYQARTPCARRRSLLQPISMTRNGEKAREGISIVFQACNLPVLQNSPQPPSLLNLTETNCHCCCSARLKLTNLVAISMQNSVGLRQLRV